MSSPIRRFNSSVRAIYAAAAVLALAAQIGIATAPVLDGLLGASASAHIERQGINKHFAHNENECLVCRAQHVTGITSAVPASLPLFASDATSIATSSSRIVSRDAVGSPRSRAPPIAV